MNARIREVTERIVSFFKGIRLTKEFFTFLGFIGLAALFWVVLAMNDNVQENLEVRLNVTNVPDTVTFINVPPGKIHVTVRDRGTTLMRTSLFQIPVINMDFKDYAQDGVFRVSKGDIQSALKHTFGANAVFSGSSLDSLRLVYTGLPGRRVPVDVKLDVKAKSGMTVGAKVVCDPASVVIYGTGGLDTINKVYCEPIIKRNMEETIEVQAKLIPIRGVRIVPSKVKVTIPVEPLVKKEEMVNIQTENIPAGYDLLLFPQSVKVVYYVPMSKFNDETPRIDVRVNYNDRNMAAGRHLPLRIAHVPGYVCNVSLMDSEVEYTLVRE